MQHRCMRMHVCCECNTACLLCAFATSVHACLLCATGACLLCATSVHLIVTICALHVCCVQHLCCCACATSVHVSCVQHLCTFDHIAMQFHAVTCLVAITKIRIRFEYSIDHLLWFEYTLYRSSSAFNKFKRTLLAILGLWTPVIDGEYLTDNPISIMAKGEMHPYPMIVVSEL